jgi:lysophospholipase L1-like esterase
MPILLTRAYLGFVLAVSVMACGSNPTRPTVTPAPAAVTAPTAQAVIERWRAGQPIRVLVIGNSISAHDDPGSGVIAQVRRLVESKHPANVVDNASVNGYTAGKALAWLERTALPAYDLAFLPLVVNDANQGNTPAEFAGTLQRVIDKLAARGIVPVLVKENDIYDIPEKRFGTPYRDFIAAVGQLAAQNRLSAVDGYTPFHAAVVARGGIEACGLFIEEMYTGLHPNQAGHDILFRAYEQWFNGR